MNLAKAEVILNGFGIVSNGFWGILVTVEKLTVMRTNQPLENLPFEH